MSNTITVTADQIILTKETEKFAVSPDQRDQVVAVANSLVLGDPKSAHNFGRSKSPDGAYLDKLLENVHVYNQGKDGKRLNEIVELARDISTSVQPGKVQQLLLKIPVVGYYATRALRLAHRSNDRFDNVKNQVSLLTEDITSISADLIGHNNNLDILYEEVLAEVHESGINIVAAGFATEHIESVLKQRRKTLKSDPENNLLALEVSNIDHQLAVLKKRKVDIIMTQQKCFEDLTMIRMMQRNNLNMLDQFETIKRVTLPSAKRAHLLVDQATQSNNRSKLVQAVGDVVNAQARHQADLVSESSIRIARQGHRPVYDESTLEHISNTIGGAAREIKRIQHESEGHYARLSERTEIWQKQRCELLLELAD
ncbi:toxic anion resistance protein [Providencia rettgeri]|uniref:Toxic anion resistance protein n=2 Tax=Moellerella wisconsensis TaxID=158849 RepID=A0A9Q8Q638_9GAMM|nr:MULTISPECIES: toxic anion resistance protein [Morganellaceae]MBN7840622.1 toxic anion resistance protein [Providencia rettgeri]MBN7854891.1 toxic anion resistance protein [Providencia rettgeri]MBN7860651.1 toxic anion resistance protein [Providencia rettgeri]MBN7870789.1 toxic anion resistance protein [Providencia rettgeri]MBN7896156.1 toxic anion resistance protein [Providencia rettgeri]